jgi:hypothetical protein
MYLLKEFAALFDTVVHLHSYTVPKIVIMYS